MKTLGIVLIAIGILMLVYTGFKYSTKEKVVDIGDIEISTNKKHTVQWPPIAGFVLIAGGIVVLVLDKRN